LSEHAVLLAVADVMGKGPGAALFAGTLRTLVRALGEPNLCPARSLTELNELMFEQLSSADMFITMQLAVADLHRRELKVANAGHCPLLLSTPRCRTSAIAPEGMPLGICSDASYSVETVPLPSGASVLLYTDGITEARNRAGRVFGQPRLEDWLRRAVARSSTAEQLKHDLLSELDGFRHGDRALDDQTFLILADETPRQTEVPWFYNPRWFLPCSVGRGSGGQAHSCR
ncbi:MAG TPA: PP2C family protein-serine/threonine phosphatase, partial [Patescibacteria group bacterium]|nr:PP2C family protein-serine/threonine phosphatase [Patescibacteria group bacterium]